LKKIPERDTSLMPFTEGLFIKFKEEQLNLSLLSIIFTIVHVQFNTSFRLYFLTKQQ